MLFLLSRVCVLIIVVFVSGILYRKMCQAPTQEGRVQCNGIATVSAKSTNPEAMSLQNNQVLKDNATFNLPFLRSRHFVSKIPTRTTPCRTISTSSWIVVFK